MLSKVKFEITAGLHNEFLNHIIENQFYVTDVKPTKLGFIATCLAKDFKTIAFIARKHQCRIKIIKKKGIGFKTRKLLQRKGLIAGAAVIFLSVIFFENLIWRIDVIGTKTRLHMSYRNLEIETGQCCYESGTCISMYQHHIRMLFF